MDLIAVVTKEEQLDVYRLSGQRAFGLKRKGQNTVDSICWKFNGQYIAVAWNDGTVDVVSSESGKAIRHGVQETLGGASAAASTHSKRISCLGWGVNFIDVQAVKARTNGSNTATNGLHGQHMTLDNWGDIDEKEDVTLDDFLDRQPNLEKLGITPDLPKQLALMDVESVLPKLPVIPPPPSSGARVPMTVKGPAEVFTSQASIDALLHSHHLRDHNAVDVLMLCYEDGTVSPMMYDYLAIGGVGLPAEWNSLGCRPLQHASHPFACSHQLLMEVSKPALASEVTSSSVSHRRRRQAPGAYDGASISSTSHATNCLALVPLTLGFVQSAGIYLDLIASKTAQLQNLLRYVDECLRCLSAYWLHSQDLPSRFMSNMNETLIEKDEGDLVTNLYHVAVTGHCSATMKEWLVDELKESGHKRWDHIVSAGYTLVTQLVLENLLPAFDRCNMAISRLRGLATYHADSPSLNLNVSPKDLTALLETIKCLQLLCHNVLTYAGEERRQFKAFSKWLRHEIDVLATTSEPGPEEEEKDPGIEYAALLQYISGGLTRSKLRPFLGRLGSGLEGKREELRYEEVRKATEMHKRETVAENEALNVRSVYDGLQRQASEVFRQVTAWQMSGCRIGDGLFLEEDEISASDMRMVYESTESQEDVTTFIALVAATQRTPIRLHRICHASNISDTSTSIRSTEALILQMPEGGEIKDLKFADDDLLLALFSTKDSTLLLSLPYRPSSRTNPMAPLYAPRHQRPITPSAPVDFALPDGGPDDVMLRPVWHLEDGKELQRFVKHVFRKDEGFLPTKLEVNGRKERRVVLVLEGRGGGGGFMIWIMGRMRRGWGRRVWRRWEGKMGMR
ncbi:hypothetical protein H2199_006927 [Coniosporium tulheliwenetii]|uniref:Uncharacterized protein n=1 Tax=Coniosporium tulheliwenetii TaxID=3383036 RepID=A0ACC2YSI0_9PEZI|nr:hypothetical protein H2199_006927 [Cladosporium sp. JES 115]